MKVHYGTAIKIFSEVLGYKFTSADTKSKTLCSPAQPNLIEFVADIQSQI